VVDRDGAVWVFVNVNGLYRYNGEGWKYFGLSSLSDPSDFAIGSNGRVWAGFFGELQEYDGEKWNTYSHSCINPSNLIVAPDDAIWFINGCDGVYRFDGKDWTHFAKDKELGGIIPFAIQIASDGALWFFSNDGWARYKQ
jgi:streptogramin lyase